MSFRELTKADVEAVAALVVRCDQQTANWAPPGWALPEGHAERELGIWLEEITGDDFWAEVALDGEGAIVGVAGAQPSQAHVTSLFVEPTLQGNGLGVLLLDRVTTHLRELGHATATLNCLADSPALRFYDRNGWRRTGREGRFDAFDMATVGFDKDLSPSG